MSDRERYFARAQSWADDNRAISARSRRVAWTVAGIACAVALFEAVAIALMLPLKTTVPVTLLVDRQTGFVQALNPLEPRRVGADAALTQSLLAQYVVAREGFDRATIKADYHRVALWSAGRARSSYLAMMPATNVASPFRRYASGTIVSAHIKSVSRLQDGVALVRFDTRQSDASGRVSGDQPWISVVRFRYSDAAMAFDDRLINPLGFQVTGYRRDQEAPPQLDAIEQLPRPERTPISARGTPLGTPTDATVRPRLSTGQTEARVTTAQPSRWSPPAPLDRREVLLGSLPAGSPLGPFSVAVPQPLTRQR